MAYLPYLDHIDPGQGGSAMVIPTYNWYQIPVKKEVFPCNHCAIVFDTYDAWFDHRFHSHPIQRPMLVLGRHELLAPRFVVMNPLNQSEIHTVNATTCIVNGEKLPITSLATLLESRKNGFYDVRLFSDHENVETKYEISVEIPSEEHVRLVEIDFGKLAAAGVLTIHSINAFIQSTSKATTAKRYTDGLANYLFGLLGKDQRGESGLTQEQGLAKLNESHQTLQPLNRPLARVVCAIIEFQLNAFSQRSGLQSVPRLQHAMEWYATSSKGTATLPNEGHVSDDVTSARVPLDSATNELLSWINSSQDTLIAQLKHIEKRAKQPDWLPADRVKAHVLAAAIFKHSGADRLATKVARGFRHDPVFKELAENLILSGTDAT